MSVPGGRSVKSSVRRCAHSWMALFSHPRVRKIFHWKFSGVVVPLLVGAGLSMALDSDFTLAYLLFVVAGVWTSLYWLTSDFVNEKNLQMLKRRLRRNPYGMAKARREYWSVSCGGIAVWVVITAACCGLIRKKQIDKELTSLSGILIPAEEPDPPSGCAVEKGGIAVYAPGKVSFVVESFPIVLVSVHHTPVITIDRDASERIMASVLVKSVDGRVIVKIDKNNYLVNGNNYLSLKRPDRSTLLVEDQYGNTALSLKYLNKHSLSIDGRFSSDGVAIDMQHSGLEDLCVIVGPGAYAGTGAIDFEN